MSTFDGKQYTVPGKCTYLALQVICPPPLFINMNLLKLPVLITAGLIVYGHMQGFNWTVIITFSKKDPSIQAVFLQHLQVKTVFQH